MADPHELIDRARSEIARIRADSQSKRTQREIVRDNHDVIVSLISDDRASHVEVALVLERLGEPVLRNGLFAEILSQIGSIKDIRAGRLKNQHPPRLPKPVPLPSPAEEENLDPGYGTRPQRS